MIKEIPVFSNEGLDCFIGEGLTKKFTKRVTLSCEPYLAKIRWRWSLPLCVTGYIAIYVNGIKYREYWMNPFFCSIDWEEFTVANANNYIIDIEVSCSLIPGVDRIWVSVILVVDVPENCQPIIPPSDDFTWLLILLAGLVGIVLFASLIKRKKI